ncbi:MAG: hypothetical protein MJK14_18740, partial [Rivularia sp. ALOHA_DT_140]|nr:hypothetical protein [Rivularia sp. ALOHA_DT_140]
QNREHPEPVISVKRNNNNIYGHSVKINGPCEIVYQPDRPLNCGAVLWIATYSTVEVKRKRFEEIVEKGCNKYKEIKDMFVVSAS